MRRSKKRHKAPWVIGLILLALICILGTELLVCRFAAPDLYDQITEPVQAMAQEAMDRGKEWVQSAAAAVRPSEQPSETPVSQAVSEPVEASPPPVEDPAVTEFIQRGELEILTGGVVETVYFNQGEEPWAQGSYGPDSIRGYGCGPTSMAMLISSMEDTLLDPIQAAQAAYESGYCAPGSGSYLSIVEGMAADYGLHAEGSLSLTADELRWDLASGHMFVALMGKGHFTNRGHFILLRGVTLEGKVLVADPNSRERSLAVWDPQLILEELSASRTSGAPLWRFSVLEKVE